VSPRGDDLDTRLLRANVIKGILEQITTANVNMVNADLLSEQRGLRIKETTVRGDGDAILSEMAVSIKARSCRFTGAQDASGKIAVAVRSARRKFLLLLLLLGFLEPLSLTFSRCMSSADSRRMHLPMWSCVMRNSLRAGAAGCHPELTARVGVQGRVTSGTAYLTKVGRFDVDVALEGRVLLVRQQDRPGLIAAVASALAKDGVNVSFMTVGRIDKGSDAIMCIGVDSEPAASVLTELTKVDGIIECGLFNQ
jgi:ACT domain/D-3-phosphoglycerate dehydrogenase intervening domain